MTLPPNNTEIEQALIASVLRNPKAFQSLADIVKPDQFYWEPFQWVWQSFHALSDAGMGIDVITLGDTLEREKKLKIFSLPSNPGTTGRNALSILRQIDITTEAAEAYAVDIQDYAVKRDLLHHASKIAEWAYNGRRASNIIADTERSFGEIVLHGGKTTMHTIPIEVAVARSVEATERASQGEEVGIDTGLIDLDNILGIQKTELVTIAARPGQGKTSLLATIALNVAKHGKKVLFFSVEMGAVLVAHRMLSVISGISAFRIMKGKIREDERDDYYAAQVKLSDYPMVICDLPGIRIGQIRNETRKHSPDLMLLDYIQLANSDNRNERRDLDVGEVSRGLVAIAKEMDIPVIAAAQLNRLVEGRSDKRPTLGDLRESGAIENDSASVVFLHFPNSDMPSDKTRDCELIVAKHRNGPVGTANCLFLKETTQFVNSTSRVLEPRKPYSED